VHVEAEGYFPNDSVMVTVPPPVTDLHVGLTPLAPHILAWKLDSDCLMKKDGSPSGSVPVENGDSVLWFSDVPAGGDVVYYPGTWTVCLATADLIGDYEVQIGESDGTGEGFVPFNPDSVIGTAHGSDLIIRLDLDHVMVSRGQYLTLRFANNGLGSVITDGQSYLECPNSRPGLPLPELPSLALLGLGLVGLGVFIRTGRKASL
jgi:hypothetical protein